MKKHNILVVEDDSMIRKTLQKELEKKDYRVDTAENGKIAIDLWEEKIYDVIIVDLRMPEMDGREVIHRIRERQPLTQIIILSGEPREKDLIDAINLHVFAYIPKKKDLQEVLTKVDEALWNRDALLVLLETRTIENPDDVAYIQGHETVTFKQIYNEIRRGSALGKEYWEDYRKSLTDITKPEKSVDEFLGVKGVI